MAGLIEDYALIGNCETGALVGRDGSIDWMCLPRFDSAACFAALLGDERNGRWRIGPAGAAKVTRKYRDGTLVLETVFETDDGAVVLTDCMSWRAGAADLLRQVTGLRGQVAMVMDLVVRFGYGADVPWVSRDDDGRIEFVAGPERLTLQTKVEVENRDMRSVAAFTVAAGETMEFALTWSVSYRTAPEALDVGKVIEAATKNWQQWTSRFSGAGEYSDIVLRSLITLKALTHFETGGIVAAATTSLPEQLGGPRNWDYRFCWLRDSFFVILALNHLGATNTMEGYLRYLDNIVARNPGGDLQPLYSITGEARIEESIVETLEGYRGMGPVRVGNLAYEQIQHDVYGAVVLAARQTFFDQRLTNPGNAAVFARAEVLGERALQMFKVPDAGPWEFRGSAHVHTFSAVMCWAACDRLARIASQLQIIDRAAFWRSTADSMREEILTRAWSDRKQSFTSGFGGEDLDATSLLLPDLGFLEASDTRFVSTLNAIERELVRGDLVFRYLHADDFGVPHNTFTMCSFWYVNALAAVGRVDEARAIFQKLLLRRNSAGLLSEDIDPVSGEQWGNFPQTYSMVGIITCAIRLSRTWEEML